MTYIEVNDLSYQYQIYQKKTGFKGTLKDLFNRQYQWKSVLKDVSLNIKQGEKVGLLGPNGAGKSTFIKLLTGILKPETGEIKVSGFKPDTNNNDFLKTIGVVMGQKSQLNWNLPASDTFKVLRSIYQIPHQIYQTRLNHYIEIFQLEKVIDVPVRKLSLGERTKLELIAALLHGPQLLILDEPTLGMDIVSQRSLYKFINKVNQDENVTVLIISHQMSDIRAVADRILVLLDGKIQFNGSIKELSQITKVPMPKIIVEGDPITSSQDVNITEQNGQSIIDDYNIDSSITLNVKSIRDIRVQNPSLEDILYEMFRKRDDDNEIR